MAKAAPNNQPNTTQNTSAQPAPADHHMTARSWKGLIASDVDGTLLPRGETEIKPDIFPLIEEAYERGICFAAASGRDYHSLIKLFAPVKDQIYFISTNGGQLIYRGEILQEHTFSVVEAEALAKSIEERPGLIVMISTTSRSILREGEDVLTPSLQEHGYQIEHTSDILQIPEKIIKVSACCPEGSLAEYEYFNDRWGHDFHITVSGEIWLDFNVSDKGTTLSELATRLGLDRTKVAAFGDQYNDLTMLQYAGHPRLMAHAQEDLLRRGFPTSPDVPSEMPHIMNLLT